jgi:hypothetical protein
MSFEELRRRLVRLRELDIHMGGADTYDLYAAEAQVSARLLHDGVHRESVRRELLALHAEQAQQATGETRSDRRPRLRDRVWRSWATSRRSGPGSGGVW